MTGLAALAIALLAAAVMGYAITRGATCMVAAAGEILDARRCSRLVALGEAAVWVAAGLSLASLAGLMPRSPMSHAIGASTIAGGLLLGVGAQLNRACVFGAVARLGSGELHYLLTPLGFLTGCILMLWVGGAPAAAPMPMAAFPAYPLVVLLPLFGFALWRAVGLLRAARSGALAAHVWSPHVATSVIGLAFVALALTAGAWTWPEALAQLARGGAMDSLIRTILFAALLGGAMIGGRGKRASAIGSWSGAGALRCFIGGALMGMGSLLVPGGNDSLILVGLPFLKPYAWLAVVTMIVAIWSAMLMERTIQRALAPAFVRE